MIAREFEGSEFELEHLATPRLVLRAPAMADATALVSLANNRNIADNLMSMPHPYRTKDAENWVKTAHAMPKATGARFGIYLKEPSGTFIGATGWGPVPGLDLPQIGYWIGEPYWNNGYATEAVKTIIDHAFKSSEIDEVGCGCRVTNAASRRVIEKCGFQYDGLGMVNSLSRQGAMPILKFRLDRGAWESLRAWGQ
ncbi:MAG: GNAT family protein [Pseudomonadota bacterium]